mmetsp:Transcript_22820/g.50704  ORF Transcript_22820/g.50704 Transcript_22820/m.50704 type:complete len:435 (-) Transcript_22820:290-1594(-)
MGFRSKKKLGRKDPPGDDSDVPPPPPTQGMFDPDVIDAADKEAQIYKEKASQEVTLSQHKSGEFNGGKTSGFDNLRKRKWFLPAVILLILAIIAGIIAGAVAASKNNRSSSASSSSAEADTFPGGVEIDPNDKTPFDDVACVPCSDIPTEFMTEEGIDCTTFDNLKDRCAVPGSWWYDDRAWDDDWTDPYPAETYCQYSCYMAGIGYPSFSPCCPEVVEPQIQPNEAVETKEDDGPCTPCSDIPDSDMTESGAVCDGFADLGDLCGTPGSWWYDDREWDDDWIDPYPPQSYCQYSCHKAGVPYPDFSNCCAIIADAPEPEPEELPEPEEPEPVVVEQPEEVQEEPEEPEESTTACVPCTDIADEYMITDGDECDGFADLTELCGVPGSWWYDVREWDDDWVDPFPAQTYCQYSCDAAGVGYPDYSPCCPDIVEV